MKRILSAAVAIAAFATAQQAYAVDFNYCVGTVDGVAQPGSPNCGSPADQEAANDANNGYFDVLTDTGSIFDGAINAGVGHYNLRTPGTFTDTFFFTIPQTGLGTGSITATGGLLTAANLDFGTVIFNNGVEDYFADITNGDLASTASILDSAVPIYFGNLNKLIVTYTVTANRPFARYDGNIAFQPVPEPTTWAMMLAGFGAVGFAMRRRNKPQPKVRFAF